MMKGVMGMDNSMCELIRHRSSIIHHLSSRHPFGLEVGREFDRIIGLLRSALKW